MIQTHFRRSIRKINCSHTVFVDVERTLPFLISANCPKQHEDKAAGASARAFLNCAALAESKRQLYKFCAPWEHLLDGCGSPALGMCDHIVAASSKEGITDYWFCL